MSGDLFIITGQGDLRITLVDKGYLCKKGLTINPYRVTIWGSTRNTHMKSVQLGPNVRYFALNDDEGSFGFFVVHAGDQVYHTHEVHSQNEFKETFEKLSQVYEQV